MQEGDSFAITPIVLPTDADNKKVTYSSENEQIATIDSNGKIVAVKEGKTKINVTTEEGGFKGEIEVIVVQKLGEDEITFDESLKVVQNEITGWDTQKLKVEDIKEKIQTSYNIKIYDHKGNELTDGQMVGTGSKIRIIDENNVIKMEYYIIIYGDVNGDGKINSLDLLVLQRHILEIERLNGTFLKARKYKQKRTKSYFTRLTNYTKAYTNFEINRAKIIKTNCRGRTSGDLLSNALLKRKRKNMKKIENITITFTLIIITLLITSTSYAQPQIQIISDKQTIKKDEEINIKLQIVDTPIAACTLEIYFDSSKLEYIKGPENSNYSNNRIIYTWVSSTGKNQQGIEIQNFQFKVLQEENNNIAVFGEFYNEQGEKVE